MVKAWKQSLRIAFTYIGTVVGAGFASGKEIFEFFVQYGTQGFLGIIIASILFIWAGVRVMIVAHRIQASSYQEMSTYLFGKTVGTLFNMILIAVLLGTTSVMLAASGTIFTENFGLPSQTGIWISMVCIFIVTQRGLNAIHSLNGIFVPLLIAFTLLVFFYNTPWRAATATSVVLEAVKPWIWFSSPLYYVALNVTLTQAVLVPIGKESDNEQTLLWGGILGGLGIGLLLLLAYTSMYTHMPEIRSAEMPMFYMLSGWGNSIVLLFALIVYAEIFSSLVANVFGLVQQIKKYLSVSTASIALFILSICYVISFVGFSSLLTLLYPLFGQIVVFFLFMLCYRQLAK